MTLTTGMRVGVYEVTAPIGQRGVGQVYRAADTKMKWHVALRILTLAVAADLDRLARFQREAEGLAAFGQLLKRGMTN